MLAWIDRLFNKHKFMRRLLVIWSMASISITTWLMFQDITVITMSSSVAYGTNCALLGTVFGFYTWSRSKDE